MTQRFAVVGDPVGHSLSPRMHAAAFAALNLDCTYEAIRAGADELEGVVGHLRSGELAGLNVTVPHKGRVLSFVDQIDASASVVEAGNTIVRRTDGKLVAHNTDVPAIAKELESLGASCVPWLESEALVLGTGATARSAVLALGHHLRVAQITVRGRSLGDEERRRAFFTEVSELLRRAGSPSTLRLEPWAPSPGTERAVRAIVQATSVGMRGADRGEIAADVVDWKAICRGCIALDVVYGEGETPLVRCATAHGLRTSDGRGVLARQGALAFELWLGRPAPLAAMRAALLG